MRVTQIGHQVGRQQAKSRRVPLRPQASRCVFVGRLRRRSKRKGFEPTSLRGNRRPRNGERESASAIRKAAWFATSASEKRAIKSDNWLVPNRPCGSVRVDPLSSTFDARALRFARLVRADGIGFEEGTRSKTSRVTTNFQSSSA